MSQTQTLADVLPSFEEVGKPVEVSLTNELVHLLSDQLYQSPLKAIEELVVNAYDAEATECRVYAPLPSDQEKNFIIVFDNGIGMTHEGLVDLWHIGRSNKRTLEVELRSRRKQIGKFGIGKLAANTIANKLTYITKTQNQILSVTVNFNDFSGSPTGASTTVKLPVRLIGDWDRFLRTSNLQEMLRLACIDPQIFNSNSWTIAVLEELKPKARKMRSSSLEWVLSTAMPLQDDFHLYLNCNQIFSSKETYEKIVEFNLYELPQERLNALEKNTGEKWYVEGDQLKSPSFEAGVSGMVIVTERTLLGKSDDIARSHGFFVRVRKRLVNQDDPLFGLKPLIHGVFNRFRADINADDLDKELKASRERFEEAKLKEHFRILLQEIFREAERRYASYLKKLESEGKPAREGERRIVAPNLVEYPVADALLTRTNDRRGAEADESWFYLEIKQDIDPKALSQNLYTTPRSKYHYEYIHNGNTGRLVKFDPATSTFWINQDHDLAKEYATDERARFLLEDFVTAEALLEIYLRESQLPPHAVGAVLEQRDKLLRSLAKDHSYSLETISKSLRDAAAEEHDLEIALIVAARALGFVAVHISGSDEPDGLARFIDYPGGEKKITLEAKSSASVPSLAAIDFAGLSRHVDQHQANGCLLLAPAYPGSSRGEDSAAANTARQLRISCWTIEQLARFIEVAESRQLTARHVLNIVLNNFSPDQVTQAINKLLQEPTWATRELYIGILKTLRQLEGRLSDSPRTIDMVAGRMIDQVGFDNIRVEEVERAITDLARASQGGMTLRDRNIIVHVVHDELERRLSGLTKLPGEPRKLSNFREK